MRSKFNQPALPKKPTIDNGSEYSPSKNLEDLRISPRPYNRPDYKSAVERRFKSLNMELYEKFAAEIRAGYKGRAK